MYISGEYNTALCHKEDIDEETTEQFVDILNCSVLKSYTP